MRRDPFGFWANPAASAKRGAPAQPDPGHLRLSGVLPLPDAEDQSLAVDWSVLDGGMQLVSALSAPSLGTGGPVEWQEGGADITLAVRGTLADPIYDGAAVITRAKIVSPLLARPLYPVNANVRIQRNTLYADSFDAKCGPRGSVKVRGAVPVLHTRRGASGETVGRVVDVVVRGPAQIRRRLRLLPEQVGHRRGEQRVEQAGADEGPSEQHVLVELASDFDRSDDLRHAVVQHQGEGDDRR